jgi:hypothetical protein
MSGTRANATPAFEFQAGSACDILTRTFLGSRSAPGASHLRVTPPTIVRGHSIPQPVMGRAKHALFGASRAGARRPRRWASALTSPAASLWASVLCDERSAFDGGASWLSDEVGRYVGTYPQSAAGSGSHDRAGSSSHLQRVTVRADRDQPARSCRRPGKCDCLESASRFAVASR